MPINYVVIFIIVNSICIIAWFTEDYDRLHLIEGTVVDII